MKIIRILRYGLLPILCWGTQRSYGDSVSVSQPVDTASYELPAPRNFNALRFALDRQHRYMGDVMPKKHSYLDFGAGIIMLKHSNMDKYEPVTNIHLRLGRQLSPLHSVRLGLSGGVGYIPSGETGDGPRTLMGMYGAEADYLFNFSSYLLGYRPERTVEFSGLLGLGFNHLLIGAGNNRKTAYDLKENSSSFNFHAGFQMKLFAGPRAAITVEPYVMVSNNGMDLSMQGNNWHKYHVSYGFNLSYLYYFDNLLSSPSDAGSFRKRFKDGERWFLSDADAQSQRRPLFFDYGMGMSAFTTFDQMTMGSTIGPSFSMAFGGWLSSAIGLRAGLNATNADWSKAEDKVNMMGYAAFSIDALINPLGFTRRYDWQAPAGVNLIGGYEFGLFKFINAGDNSRSMSMGYRLGIQPWLRLGHNTRLFVEPVYAFLLHRLGNENRKRDDQLSVRLGVELLMGGQQPLDVDGKPVFLPAGYFVGVGGGWNTTIKKWRFANTHSNLLKNGLLMAGYHFDGYNGVMLSGEYLTEKVGLENDQEQRWKYWMLSADYKLNLSNFLAGMNHQRTWNFSALAGPTLAVGEGKPYLGVNVGFQLDYRLSRYFSLFYQQRFYWMSKHLYETNQYFNQAGNLISSSNVGLMWHFDDWIRPTVRVAKGVAQGVSHVASSFGHGVGKLFQQERSPFFVDYGYGISWQPGMQAGLGDSFGASLQASMGWWMLPAVGVRGGVNMSRRGAFSLETSSGEADRISMSTTASLFADLLVNPLGFVSNYDWSQRWGLSLIAGVHKGFFMIKGSQGIARGKNVLAGGWRAGMQVWFKLQDDLRLHVEPMYTHLNSGDVFVDNATKTHVSQTHRKDYSQLDMKDAVSIRIGLTALLRNPRKRHTATFDDSGLHLLQVAAGGGWNFNLNTWKESGEGVNLNALLMASYAFSPLHTVRAQFEYVTAKEGQNTSTNLQLASLDYQISMTSLLAGYQPANRWDVGLSAGPSMNMNKKRLGVNFGLNAHYRLDSHWGLFYLHNVYLFGRQQFQREQFTSSLSLFNTFNVGLSYRF